MIRVQLYENAIVVDGHARRNTNGAAECCAAVSAAMQTALAYYDICGYRRDDITSPYQDHGGHMVIYTDHIKGNDNRMILALTDILQAQAETWPDEMRIEVMAEDDYEPED